MAHLADKQRKRRKSLNSRSVLQKNVKQDNDGDSNIQTKKAFAKHASLSPLLTKTLQSKHKAKEEGNKRHHGLKSPLKLKPKKMKKRMYISSHSVDEDMASAAAIENENEQECKNSDASSDSDDGNGDETVKHSGDDTKASYENEDDDDIEMDRSNEKLDSHDTNGDRQKNVRMKEVEEKEYDSNEIKSKYTIIIPNLPFSLMKKKNALEQHFSKIKPEVTVTMSCQAKLDAKTYRSFKKILKLEGSVLEGHTLKLQPTEATARMLDLRKFKNIAKWSVLVNGLDPHITDQHLWEHFQHLGAIKYIQMPTYFKNGNILNFGMACIIFFKKETFEQAVKLGETEIMGCKIKIQQCMLHETTCARRREFSIQVEGLPPDATENDIKNHFSIAGSVASVGMGEHAAFVTFQDANAYRVALKLSGTKIKGSKLEVAPLPPRGIKRSTSDAHDLGFPKKKCPSLDNNRALAVVVKQLPAVSSLEDLKKHFEQIGNVNSVELNYRNENSPIAFVHFADEGTCQKALELDGSELSGNKITVQRMYTRWNTFPNRLGGHGYVGQSNEALTTGRSKRKYKSTPYGVLVKGLHLSSDGKAVRQHFTNVDGLANITMVKDSAGLSCGFAYVDLKTPEGLKDALSLNGTLLDGHSIKVICNPRKNKLPTDFAE